MALDSKIVCNSVTKEIESRIKEMPDHLFEVFLEIREPIDKQLPDVISKYPIDYSDEIIKNLTIFAYPCKLPSDDQGEHFAFVVLDTTATLFRFGYCRRSNRESTCLCIISYYPWFEVFYTILNDLSQIISTKSTEKVIQFLSSLYNYKLMSIDEFYEREGKETIQIDVQQKKYVYIRPDTRKLPSMLSNRNFTVMFSRLGPEIMLSLFSHLLFERRILFVSSKLFHLTACVYGCLHLIYPMHWQSIFLPILPSIMSWTAQCTAPYIIGMHSSIYSTLNRNELGDAVIVNIDERKIDSPYDDLGSIPKYIVRSMKKGIQQSSQLTGDHLARVFLRAMAYSIGNYANGFVIRNDRLDFDRELYLEQYLGSSAYTFLSSVANTQMFEQFSRYRTYAQFQRETDVDEFDFEVRNFRKLQQSKKFKTNKKIYKLLEKYVKDGTIVHSSPNSSKTRAKTERRKSLSDTKDERNQAANPVLEQVRNKAENLQIAMNKAGQRVANEASSVRSNFTSLDIVDVMKRTNHMKPDKNNENNNTMKPIHHVLSSPNFVTEKTFSYQRFDSNQSTSSYEPNVVSDDRRLSTSSDSSSSTESEHQSGQNNHLINLDFDDNRLLPSPIELNIIHTSIPTPPERQNAQINPKIKQLQDALKHKVQTFDSERLNSRDEYGQKQNDLKILVKQFDPLADTNSISNEHSIVKTTERHPSIYETIPTNHVSSVLESIKTNYGTTSRSNLRSTYSMPLEQQKNLIHFSPRSATSTSNFLNKSSNYINDSEFNFDPLAPPSNNTNSKANNSSTRIDKSNLIDF